MDFQSLAESQNTRRREGQNPRRRQGSPKSLAECPTEIAPISTYGSIDLHVEAIFDWTNTRKFAIDLKDRVWMLMQMWSNSPDTKQGRQTDANQVRYQLSTLDLRSF